MKKYLFLFLLLPLFSGRLPAQDQLRLSPTSPSPLSGASSGLALPGFQPATPFISSGTPAASFSLIRPAFVRKNPRGYSYLCRLELEIEEKLPVGVWIKTGDAQAVSTGLKSNAHVRFKLLNF